MNASDELKTYINSKEHTGAFLLTGKWGCGKTYLIKNLKSEIDSDSKVMLIVSLFGIDSVEMLTKTIKEQILKMFFGIAEDNKKIKFIQKLTNSIASFSDKLSSIKVNVSLTINEFINIEKNVKVLGKDKEIVLVFDDFERSKLNTIELLGVINEFCENRHIKTIVIADEEKIKEENQKNKKYTEFKEKVIQNTCKLSVNYEDIIKSIVENYVETYEGYLCFISENTTLLIRPFYESNSDNLRTIKAILLGFERIYEVCKQLNINDTYLKNMFYSYSVMVFENKKDNFKKSKYGYLVTDASFKNNYALYNKNGSALNCLKEYVGDNEWNELNFINEVKGKYQKTDLSFGDKFLNYDFWEFNDEIIDKGLTECLNKAYEGNLNLDGYISILNKVATLTELHYELPCQVDYQNMSKALENKKDRILHENYDEPKKNTFIDNNRLIILGEDAIYLNNQIEKFNRSKEIWSNKKRIISEMKGNHDFSMLFDQTIDCLDDYMVDEIFEAYKKSDSYDRREIGRLIKSLNLNNSNYSNELEKNTTITNLNKLKNKISELCSEESDRFNRIIHNEMIQLLNEKIDELINKKQFE